MEIERTGSDAARPPYSHDDVAALHRPLVSPPAFVLDSPGPDLEGETQDVCGASATADMSPLLFGQSGTSRHIGAHPRVASPWWSHHKYRGSKSAWL